MVRRQSAFVTIPAVCRPGFVASAASVPHFRPVNGGLSVARRRPRCTWLGASVRTSTVHPARAPWVALLGGGGILGVGTPEVLVIVAVGWFILGPTKLFSLSRDIGKLIGDLRRSATDAKSTFTEAMEMELAASATKTIAPKENEKGDDADVAMALAGSDKHGTDIERSNLDIEVTDDDVVSNNEDDENVSKALREMASARANGPLPAAELNVPDRSVDAVRLPELAFGGGEVGNVQSKSDLLGKRKRFLDQLKRASDPQQVSDLEMDAETIETAEEDVEVARLEYELAKARLAAKRKREQASGTSSINDDVVHDVPPLI